LKVITSSELGGPASASQIGISRAQIGGVLTSLTAAAREVDYPIKRDAQHDATG
jgi:hypothetical protein